MNKSQEISKIQDSIKIPVTDIEFNVDYVQIESGNKIIGGIPYFSISNIITYDINKNVLDWLNWTDVYKQNKNEIDGLIIDLVGTDKIVISIGTFRNLYVKNENGILICTVNCSYENKWAVTKIE